MLRKLVPHLCVGGLNRVPGGEPLGRASLSRGFPRTFSLLGGGEVRGRGISLFATARYEREGADKGPAGESCVDVKGDWT